MSSSNGRQEGDYVSISEWIAHAVADTGCEVVYGGHGGALVPLVNAVCAHPKLTWVCARTEHDAATMAAAHAKMTGGLGVVIATSGPGATNLTTGLMEASMDRVSVLAITGMKPTAQLGYAEFQDVNQSRLFAGAGIEWSKDAASPHAVLPLLRDAVATALTQRTCAHLAIPVDIQAAPSPLPLKHFCASHANLRISSPTLDATVLDAAAATLVGSPQDPHRPRTIVAVGLRAITSSLQTNKKLTGSDISNAILELAQALDAPVLTRLHAKGVVDEFHPLSFGVIGVHGKPGLEAAATLISSSDRVLSIGIEDETLLLCNSAGLQIRKVIEIEPDAVAVSTRFNAEHTILGNIDQACLALATRIRTLKPLVQEQRDKQQHQEQDQHGVELHHQLSKTLDHFSYMSHHSPDSQEVEINGEKHLVRPVMEELGIQGLVDHSKLLWDALHSGEWKRLLHAPEGNHNNKTEPTPALEPTDVNERSESSIRYDCDVQSSQGSTSYCHPAEVLRALSEARLDETCVDAVSRNAVVAVDVGDVTLWASLCLTLRGGSRTLYSERLGTMGYGLCAGIAAVLAQPPPAAAVVLAGDGGFQMTLNELSTFQQLKRPGDKLLCIVFDNQLLGRVIFGFDNALGCEIVGPDYVALAKSYGGDGIRLNSNEDARTAVRQAMAAQGLFLIHVIVDPTLKADMATFKDTTLQVMNSG